MALMDIFNSIVGNGAPAPDVSSIPAGGEQDVMALMKQYMVDSVPRPEDDFRKQLAHALIAGGKGMATTPGNFGAGLIGGLAPGTAGFVDKGEDLEGQRYKGAAGVLQQQLNEDKLTQAAEAAEQRAQIAQEKLAWQAENAGLNREAQMERLIAMLAGRKDVAGMNIEGRASEGALNRGSREGIAADDRASREGISANTQEGLNKRQQYELEYRQKRDADLEAGRNSRLKSQIESNQKIQLELKKRASDLRQIGDPQKRYVEMKKLQEQMRTNRLKGIDPSYDKDAYDKAFKEYEDDVAELWSGQPANPSVVGGPGAVGAPKQAKPMTPERRAAAIAKAKQFLPKKGRAAVVKTLEDMGITDHGL